MVAVPGMPAVTRMLAVAGRTAMTLLTGMPVMVVVPGMAVPTLLPAVPGKALVLVPCLVPGVRLISPMPVVTPAIGGRGHAIGSHARTLYPLGVCVQGWRPSGGDAPPATPTTPSPALLSSLPSDMIAP
ncbi:hypothetical protein GCM10009626_33770 [Brachybacterium sacelli]